MTQKTGSNAPSRHRFLSVATYGFTSALPRLSNAVLAIFYTSVFSAAEYGAYGILAVTVVLISTLLDLGMGSAVMRDFYEHHRDWEKTRRFMADLSLSADILALSILPLLGAGLYFGWAFLDLQSNHATIYGLLLLAIGMADRAGLLLSSLLRAAERPFNYAAGPICEAISLLVCGVIFVTIFDWGVPGATAALLVGRTTSLITYRAIFHFSLGIRGGTPNWRLIQKCLTFGLPLVPTRLANWARESGLRPILTSVVSMNAIGAFSFASSLSALPALIAVAVDLAIFPYYLKQRSLDAKGFALRVTNFSASFLAAVIPIWAALILFSRELVNAITTVHFAQSGPICAILLCASFIRMQQPFFVRQIHFLRHTWIQLAVMVPSALVSIGLSLFLASRYGIEQAAWGVLVAEAMCFFGLVFCIRLYEPVHYPIRAAAIMGVILASLAGLTSLQDAVHWADWQVAVVKISLVIAVTGVCWILWLWPNRELMRSLVRS